MKLGLQLNSFDWTGSPDRFADTLAEIARTTEEVGFDRIGVADHLWQHPIMGGPETNEPECYTMLAFLAASTSRIKLTAMVTGAHFRYPGLLAKTVTTLDVLSEGRASLGIGSGHYEEEARGLGIPFPRKESASRCCRRRSGSASRCGAATRGPTSAGTSGSTRPCAYRRRWPVRTRRS